MDYAYGRGIRPRVMQRIQKEGRFGTAVELACGTGYFTKAIADQSDSLVATDIADEMVRITKECTKDVRNVTVQIEDCEKTSFRDASFDTIVQVLGFGLTDAAKTVEEYYRILKPGGRLILCTSGTFRGTVNKLMYYARRLQSGTKMPPDYHEYSGDEIRSLMEKAGFSCITYELIRDESDRWYVPLQFLTAKKNKLY